MPAAPNFTDTEAYAADTDEIVIAADLNAVFGDPDKYKFISANPVGAPATASDTPVSSNMSITGLDPGTSYDLTFSSLLTICGLELESTEQTTISSYCTSRKAFCEFEMFEFEMFLKTVYFDRTRRALESDGRCGCCD